MTYVKHLLAAWRRWRAQQRHPHVRGLSAHLARDIGLSEAELARLRHKHPSETTHHPRG